MMNDLFNALGGKPVQAPTQEMIASYKSFQRNFKGSDNDARQKLFDMMRSGKLSPQGYQMIQQQALMMQNYIK